MPALFSELIDVLLDTEEFFQRIGKWGKKRALAYFGFISAITLLINFILLTNNITPAGLIPFENIIVESLYLHITLVYFISGFFFAVMYAFLLRVILGRMNASTSFTQIFKVIVYGLTPPVLALWVPVLGIFLFVWSIYLIAMGLGVYNQASFKTNIKASLIGGIIVSVFVVLFLLGIGYYIITSQNADLNLLWGVLIPISG